MKFIEFNKTFKSNLEHLYNIVGDDYFLIRQAIFNIKQFLIKDFEEFNFSKLDAEKFKAQEVESVVSTLPIGNDYRLVVLNNPSVEACKFLNKYQIDDSVVVVCVNAEKLEKASVVDCSKLDRMDITKYILNYLSKFNISIKEEALDYIIDACNSNMSNIVNELGKLTSFVAQNSLIDMNIATNLVANESEYAIFMLTNAIDNKDYARFQKILNELSAARALSDIYAYLGKYFKKMQYICVNKDDNAIANILNVKPYAIKMSRQYVAQNGIQFYLKLYQKYIDLDYKVKSGEISVENALYLLVF